jgi:transposase
VGASGTTACVRVPDGHGGRYAETRRFATTTAGLMGWPSGWPANGVTRVGMESTGCYWKPVWHLLEDQVECWLLNAAHMHNVPGRNPDDADAACIAQLIEHGRPASCAATPLSGWQERTVRSAVRSYVVCGR